MNPVAEKCPRCGRSTKMENGEILAYCSSCKSLHEPGERANVDVEIAKYGNVSEGARVYIPFWRFFCTFRLDGDISESHRNVRNFIKDGNEGKIFIYVPAAELDTKETLEAGAFMTAMNPSYETTFSFNDTEHMKCVKGSEIAKSEIQYYFLAAETSKGREDDMLVGFNVEPAHEKLVFLPYYRKAEGLTPAV